MARLRSNDQCWCGSGAKFKRCHGDRQRLRRQPVQIGAVSPMRAVPPEIERPPYVATGGRPERAGAQIHDLDDDGAIARLRHAGCVAAEVLRSAGDAVAPGVTTEQLDAIAHDAYVRHGAYPSTLGYKGYPKSICTSVNGVICHGIPDDRPLRDGDIVNVDVTAYVEGVHGDTSATFVVGRVDDAVTALVETTREATLRGIAAIAAGRPVHVIADAIEPFAASRGFGVVAEYGGHGIGATFHAPPHVHHVRDRTDTTMLVEGMTLTVEPMLTCGGPTFTTADDGWTERLVDAMPSAQFEHTVLVTSRGAEILTITGDGALAVGTPHSPVTPADRPG